MAERLTILLIEDNPDDRLIIERGLKEGFNSLNIEEIGSQKKFNEAIKRGGFEIVITDYNLSWADGITLNESINKLWPDCPVILISAIDTEEIRLEAADAGIDHFIIKSPAQIARLPDFVRSILAEKKPARQLTALTTAAAAISSHLEIDQVLKTVAEQISDLLDISRCTIYLRERETDNLTLLAEHPDPEHAADSLPGKLVDWPFIAEVLENGSFLQLHRGTANLPAKYKKYLDDKSSYSILIIPLVVQNVPAGYIEMAHAGKSHSFSQQDINLVQMLGSQAAIAIDNARLMKATRHQLLELTTLNQLSTFAARTTEEDAYIEFVTKLISETFYPFNFGILLLDDTNGVLQPHRSYNHNISVQKEIVIPLGEGITGFVAQTGKMLNVPDIADFQGYLSYDPNTRSEICVPMKINDQVIGVINAENPHPNAFDEADTRLLNFLASQISIALERIRKIKLETRLTRQLSILNQLGSQMTGVLNRKQLCDQITQGLVSNFGYYNCGILTLSEDKDDLSLDSVSGTDSHMFRPGEYHQNVGTGLIGLAVREGRPVLENDVSKSIDFFTVEESQVRAELVLPLIAEDQVIGALVIDSNLRDAFEKSDVSALTSLADQLATALEKIRLFDQTAEDLRREQLLNKVVRCLSERLDQKSTLKNILQLACETVGADTGSIGILSEDGSTLNVLRADDYVLDFNLSDREFPNKPGPGDSFGWKIIDNCESILFNDCDTQQHPFPGTDADQICSFIGAPVIAADTIIGAVMVYNHSLDKTLTERDLALIETIGRQVGIAIQNTRLFEETREALVRERVLNEITSTVSSALDLDAIIAKVTELAALLVGAETSALSLIDPGSKSTPSIYYYNPPPGAPTTTSSGGIGLFAEVLSEGKSFLLPNYRLHPNAMNFWVEAGIQSSVAIPLLAGEVTIGVLGVFSKVENHFNQRDLELLQSVAQQTGVVIQKALLFEEARRRSEEIAALYDIALSTSSVLDTLTLLKQLHNKVQQLIQPDSFGVFLYDDETEELEIVMALDNDNVVDEAIGARFPLADGGLTGWVMQNRETLLIGDTERDPLPATPKQYTTRIRTWLGIPLIARDRLIGTISVQSLKPDAFDPAGVLFLESLAGQVAIALENARLYEELEDAFVQTVLALANAMDVRDTYTHDHSQRIAFWAQETGRVLGCNDQDLEILSWAALFHDIGKIGVPDDILLKPASLTEEEYEVIKQHPALGASILAPVKKLKEVAPIIRHHQEKFDGTGYPDGLRGSEIPLASRILSVIDSYTAMTDDRVYRRAHSPRQAVEEIRNLAGKQYDPAVVEAFIVVLEKQSKIGLQDQHRVPK